MNKQQRFKVYYKECGYYTAKLSWQFNCNCNCIYIAPSTIEQMRQCSHASYTMYILLNLLPRHHVQAVLLVTSYSTERIGDTFSDPAPSKILSKKKDNIPT